MNRRLAALVAAIAVACPHGVSALALGDLKLRSALNEPLNAEIDLLSVTADELADVRAALAQAEEFRRAGVDRPNVLSRLRFQVEQGQDGRSYIKVTTKQPVREPFLNFLLELNWPRGRLVREYTLLLDPPVYGAGGGAVVAGPVLRAETTEPRAPAPQTAAAPVRPAVRPAGREAAGGVPGSYGPVARGDTLWSIANKVRPDASVTTHQMMVALLRANPEAFAYGNVNALKAGQVLRVPEREAIAAVSQAEALAEVRRQENAWEDYRQGVARTPRPSPPASPTSLAGAEAEAAAVPPPAKPEPKLQIVAAGTTEGSAGESQPQTLEHEVTLLQEDVDARRQEIAELQARLTEAENLIRDLQRLVQLKDATLAALQQQAILSDEAAGSFPAPTPTAAEGGSPARAEAGAADGPQGDAAHPPAGEGASPVAGAASGEPAAAVGPAGGAVAVAVAGDDPLAAPEAAPAVGGAGYVSPGPVAVEAREGLTASPEPAPVTTAPEAPSAMTRSELAAGVEPAPAVARGPGGGDVARLQPAAMSGPGHDAGRLAGLLETLGASPNLLWGGLAGVLALLGGLLALRRRRPALESAALESAALREAPSAEPSEGTVARSRGAADRPSAEERSGTVLIEPRTDESRLEDPMAEVNVYLAYERFEQAEEIARAAIEESPDRHEYRLKLLEIHHAAKNAEAFERDAALLRAAVGDESPLMATARSWWRELAPDRVLVAGALGGAVAFAAGATAAAPRADDTQRLPDLAHEAAIESVVEPESARAPEPDRVEVSSGEVDLELSAEEVGEPSTSEPLDFELEGLGPVPGAEGAVDFDLTDEAIAEAIREASEALDFDLGVSGPATGHPATARDLDLELADIEPADTGLPVAQAPGGLDVLAAEDEGSAPQGAAGSAAESGSDATDRLRPVRSVGSPDLDLALEPLAGEASPAVGQPASAERPLAALDFELEPPAGDAGGSAQEVVASSEALPGLDLVLEHLTGVAGTGERAADRAPAAPGPEAGGAGREGTPPIDLELDLDLTDQEDVDSFFLDSDGGAPDEVGTKLDLARAYIDMGDTEGARGILSEVITEGDDNQRGEAKDLLARIG